MNTNYLPNETSQQHRERLDREMDAEVVKHKEAITGTLRAKGHTVIPPEDLAQDYLGQGWKVNGQYIEVKSRKLYKGPGCYSTPNGGLRITVGPYNNRKTFVKKTSAKELAKNPAGFDYADIAEAMVRIIAEEKEREQQEKAARKRAEENDAIALPAARRLMREFKLKSFFGDYIPEPILVDRGHKELGLKFGGLTEEQARTILAAARAAGALKERE